MTVTRHWSLASLPAQRLGWATLDDDPFAGPSALGWVNPWLRANPEINRWRDDDLTFTARRWLIGDPVRCVEFDPASLGFRAVSMMVPMAHHPAYRWGDTLRDQMMRRTMYWSDGRASISGFDHWQPCGPDTPVIAIAIGTYKFRVVPFGNLRREAALLLQQAAIGSGPWQAIWGGRAFDRNGKSLLVMYGGRQPQVLDPVLVEKWRTR